MLGWSDLEPNREAGATDVTGAPQAAQSGLLSGTRVATAFGWRPVQALAAGDRVLTFDHGLQPLADVTRRLVWTGSTVCPQRFWPLEVARGVLGNRGHFRIMPGQAVMIESDLAEAMYGDPFALLPALALTQMTAVDRRPPPDGAEVVLLHFEETQVVFADHGMMFLCPATRNLLDYALGAAPDDVYEILSPADAQRLIAAIDGAGAIPSPVEGLDGA
ncbi:MAG: Hint domain-containing protein [Roseovarius sp.]|jgi:hypothetical protein|uniref:Hint domain-containing protein n=1 Tax=Roseovarius sp. TaxID=1486281 RepID=UPI0032ED6522